MGTKHRPFYRMVVAKSAAGRDSSFVDILGTYNPVVRPAHVHLDGEKALAWLMQGAQPTETAAILLKQIGVLDKYFEARPAARKSYKFLDKRTAAISTPTAVEATVAAETAEA